MYHLIGNDETFFENVVFNKIEFLNQKLWPFQWNLAYCSQFFHDLALTILKSRDRDCQLFHLVSY